MNEFALVQQLSGNLSGIDFMIIAVSILLIFIISYVFGHKEQDTTEIFLGGRRIPPVAASLSFVAAEISL